MWELLHQPGQDMQKGDGMRLRCTMRVSQALVAVLLAVTFSVGTAKAEEFIRVASFNIANLGDRDEYKRSLIALTNIIRETEADLVAIQEVEPNDLGEEQIIRLTELLNIAAKHDGTNLYSHELASEHTGDETTAFIWRQPVALLSDIEILTHEPDSDGDGLPTFQRAPSVATFSAGNIDFMVVNVHLYTKEAGATSEGRDDELDALRTWLVSLEGASENDAIVLGDFNRFLNDSDKSSWAEIYTTDHADHYRFPLLEAIANAESGFDPNDDNAPKDEYSTTTSKSKNIYDQIIVSAGLYPAFVDSPVFGEDVGIVPFDDDPHYEWFMGNWHKAVAMLSDHRPIWIRVKTDGPDDD